ncbi:MAG: N-acetylmuramoyl-L-alanine amidase [Oscillospiraceae bacterium]|nr:N-acetylmuramoyl-L-alanine amidase [Oscillospiraceae bacterium]
MEKLFIVAADAGHYMGTPGKRCMQKYDPNKTREWVLNDRVARAFQERAAAYEGFIVVRVDDPTGRTETTLQERVALANAIEADFYWSPHHNAGINGTDRQNRHDGGIVAYCSKGSTRSPEWRDAIYDASIAAGGIRGDRTEPKARADWYVCRNTNMPAVLMEYGFMDSADDVPIILDPDYSKRMGIAAADAVAKKAGLKLKPAEKAELPCLRSPEQRYVGIVDAPEFSRAAIGTLMACGALNGTGGEKGIDMTYDMLRILTIMMRYVKHIHELKPDAPEIHDDLVEIPGGDDIVRPVEPPAPNVPTVTE